MRMPLATDFKTRPNDNDRDARIKNGYVEVKGEQAAVRVRPGNSDLGSLGGAGLAQLLAEWNGLLSVIGDGANSIAFSYDPASWPASSASQSPYLSQIIFDGTQFVAIHGSSDIGVSMTTARSTDGVSWTFSDWDVPALLGVSLRIAFSGTTYVAVASSITKSYYSMDAENWTQVSLPSSGSWMDCVYGGGAFVTFKLASTGAAYSNDEGATWNTATLPSSSNWIRGGYGAGTFVIVSTTNAAAYSTDGGQTWSAATLSASASWRGPAYGNGVFVAVSYGSNKATYSADGISWNSATLPSSANWSLVTFANGYFVAVAENTTKVAYSQDGITWTAATLPGAYYWIALAGGSNLFVVGTFDTNSWAYADVSTEFAVPTAISGLSPITADLLMSAETTGAAQSNQQMLIKTSEQGWIYTR